MNQDQTAPKVMTGGLRVNFQFPRCIYEECMC